MRRRDSWRLFPLVMAFLLFCGSLVPRSDLRELVKLPGLFRHFSMHRKADPAFGFAKFLDKHYLQQDHRKAEDHSALPLFAAGAQPQVFVPQEFFTLLLRPSAHEIYPDPRDESARSYDPSSFWQPPKIA